MKCLKKVEKEYIEVYGDIPKNDDERLGVLIKNTKFTNASRNEIFPLINKILNMKWKRVDLVIYLLPKATPRPRHNFKMNIFYVSGAKDNRDIFRKFLSKTDLEMITTACKFTCISYLPIPKSMSSIEKIIAEMGLIRPITKPDWDNLGKTYSDMIQEYLLFDDSLIIDGTSKKFYSSKPRIEIHIEYMDGYDCHYNEKLIRKKVNK